MRSAKGGSDHICRSRRRSPSVDDTPAAGRVRWLQPRASRQCLTRFSITPLCVKSVDSQELFTGLVCSAGQGRCGEPDLRAPSWERIVGVTNAGIRLFNRGKVNAQTRLIDRHRRAWPCAQERAADPAIENDLAARNATVENPTTPIRPRRSRCALNETTWEYTDIETKKPMQQSIDANGNYIIVSGTEHIDHGTATIKDGKACFTSAMTKEGEECWKDPILAIGQSGESVSDKGEKLVVKRTAYVPLTM